MFARRDGVPHWPLHLVLTTFTLFTLYPILWVIFYAIFLALNIYGVALSYKVTLVVTLISLAVLRRKIGRLNPMKRGGVPDEIASVALFLASGAASYVNGQAIAVDGGLSASHPFSVQDYGRTSA